MRFSHLVHKIPDSAILGVISVGVLILLVYLIASISSFKHEIGDLKDMIQKMRIEQKEDLKVSFNSVMKDSLQQTIRDEFTYDRQNFKFIIEE